MSRDSTRRVCLFKASVRSYGYRYGLHLGLDFLPRQNHRLAGRVKLYPRPAHSLWFGNLKKLTMLIMLKDFQGLEFRKTQTWLWVVQNWWNGGTILI